MLLSDAERSMLLEQLAREPGELAETFTHEATLTSPACGDEVTVRLTVVAGQIQEISWRGHGCTVSMAATAAMAALAPLSVPAFGTLQARYTAAVNGQGELEGDLEPFAGIGRFPLRAQCATLGWRALAAALAQGD